MRKRGLILAFGAGTLLGAVAYELIEDSLADSERGIEVAVGFALGALTFYFGSVVIERMQGGDGSSDADRGATAARDPHGQAVVGLRGPRGWPSCSAPCSTGSPSRSCWGCR